ncbi:hypothetical protein CGCSCA1_v005771 [Colletotrichum siamense]|nr:hypothetical protein CGCSCA1_v005771 [Colletotrichum siamense]
MHEETERRHQRPDLPVRGASDPVTRKSQSTSHIERDLHNLIKDGPSAKNREQQIGNIYLFKVKSATTDVELLKIGRTQKPAETRRKQIKGVCQHIHIEEHRRAVAEMIDFHGYAEKLVHTELANFQHQWVCSCGTSHQEYFDVREDLAVEVFTRWRDFCKQKPWAPDGKILPAWEQRLANKPKFGGDDHEPDHWELAKHWRRFTSPIAVERIASDAIRVWKDLFPERWQFVAIAELLTIICVSPISFWVTTWAVVIGSLLLIDLVVIPDLHLFKWIDRLMSGGLQPFRWGGGGEQGGKGDCNLSASPEGHGMQTPTPSERPTRGVNHPTFTSMYVGRHDDPSIMADSSPGAFPSVSPGATDCESDMEVGVCCSPCAEKASRRRTPDIRVDPASANPEVTVDENFDMEVVE